MPKGYVIVGDSLKALLPNKTWEQARNRINELFRKAGGLQAVYVKKTKDLKRLDLNDSVVECYLNSTQASFGFRFNVYNQLNTLGRKFHILKSLATKFNRPDGYKVHVGRSFTVKGIFVVPSFLPVPELVCITYAVISLTPAFAVWAGLLVRKTKTTLATIGSAPEAEQLSLGITLGNLIAHEMRHQMGLSKTGTGITPVHTGTGLGMDGVDFRNPKIRFSDEAAIRTNLAKLRLFQNKYKFSHFPPTP